MNSKHVFWQALILAIFIFLIGILIGYMLEANRTSKVISSYQYSELGLLDVGIYENFIALGKFDCNKASNELIRFADEVYDKAIILEDYSRASQLSDGILMQHKKFDLLRASLWLNVINVKQKCPNKLNSVVYFFEYDSKDVDITVKQDVFSKYLSELKKDKGNNTILIPIAGNLNLSSINFLKESYEITELPTILINEEHKVTEMKDIQNIKDLII